MALQLGALRDALEAAGAKPEQARAASEEVAGYDRRLMELSTRVKIGIGLVVVLIGSQVALWIKLGVISGQLASIARLVQHQ